MIKFFRNIRRVKLTENRFGKYMLYAIGEIILVVIGILIALQINNWNDNRKTDVEEDRYLSSLKSDLERDIMVQDSIAKILKSKIENLKGLEAELKSLPEDNAYPQAMDYYAKSIGFPEFVSNDHTLETLKSSGNIEAISNKKLRVQLLDYYDDVEVYYRTQNAANEVMIGLMTNHTIFDLKVLEDKKWYKQNWLENLKQREINSFTNEVFVFRSILMDLMKRLGGLGRKAMQISRNTTDYKRSSE